MKYVDTHIAINNTIYMDCFPHLSLIPIKSYPKEISGLIHCCMVKAAKNSGYMCKHQKTSPLG